MGIYYEWSDYRDKGLNESRIHQLLVDKGMNIVVNNRNNKEVLYMVKHFDEAKIWGRENLSDMWTSMYASYSDESHLKLFFSNEEDAVAFKLRWEP